MRVLVTGGAGFIGSHLVNRLVECRHKVTVFDNFSTGNRSRLNHAAEYMDVCVEDCRSHNFVYDVIFHLAAEARIQPSFSRPFQAHSANVTGTVSVLELARATGAKVVYAGSSTAYHDHFANPYAFTKATGENYCKLYNKVYGVPTAIARFFNVYGSGQPLEGPYATVVGVFEGQRRSCLPLTVTGTGEQRRDFCHVSDIVDGLIGMSEVADGAETFDLGTGVNHSINEVAAMFKHPVKYIPARPGEAFATLASVDKAAAAFGYSPKRRLKDYIESVAT